jgi:hypothetical protein
MSIYTIADDQEYHQHFNIEKEDPSLNGGNAHSLGKQFNVSKNAIDDWFLSKYHLQYITNYIQDRKVPFQIVTHPQETRTCYEKARILGGWNPLNVIKALYFESPLDNCLYVVVVPETGCFIDRQYLTTLLGLPRGIMLAKAKVLPTNMTYGTCSPFVTPEDLLENGGKVAKILFDSETLIAKKHENLLDDFSFGLDHRLSLQINYYHCYKMLKAIFRHTIFAEELLTLSFTEKFSRKNGKIKINYDFKSINYRTAQFINDIHGVGDVSIENDYVDELDLPDILTST